ncbi:hypothetical protein LGV61_01140 [Desulfurispirillum indicum]|uniref:Uncharacterized protein n=1 Tax=Desulfurispirillum indicum (strain ATCC BAA-1389 / DSM 22839 / S5) TaxID=653733 RepID=E6W6K4_DESIS|nr:hypothetical protein [Desulfurispirillum indicum]ADU65004.1 hypothetical protein Selin_0248 [Desulfurispirillum indicum S5]UCZ56907.1 hypothetical protein LGV61_01140 [Desulfurispirillum indicum]
MASHILFRLRETLRFLVALFSSRTGRGFIAVYLLNILVLALVVLLGFSALLFGLFEGMVLRRRTMMLSLGTLVTLLVTVPLITMPFFSFKDVIDRFVNLVTRRRLFVHLSDHVFYRPTVSGHISLHLAKAHAILDEKYRLLCAAPQGTSQISRQLAISLGRSIRDAVRLSRDLVEKGRLKKEQLIVGATYGYLFGAAKSKLGLRRHQPSWFQRLFSDLFYRFGALHAVYMYFIIHDSLPPSFDPVYFMASIEDVVGTNSSEGPPC